MLSLFMPFMVLAIWVPRTIRVATIGLWCLPQWLALYLVALSRSH